MTDNRNCQEIYCPVGRIIQMIGGKYKALILWNLIEGVKRFNYFRRVIPKASPRALTKQLRELEKDGLISRKIYPQIPPKVEYSLTAKGEQIIPMLRVMYDYGSIMLQEEGKFVNCGMKK